MGHPVQEGVALDWARYTKKQWFQLGVVAHRVRIARKIAEMRRAAGRVKLRPFVAALADLLVADLTRHPRLG
jgi:hypothetical protein